MRLLLVGGIGRMEDLYRQCAKSLGYDLDYREQRLPHFRSGNAATYGAVLVVVDTVSHPLRDAGKALAEAARCPLLYVRQPSLSALRRALAEIRGPAQEVRR